MTRTQTFVFFFSIVLTIYGLLNTYIFIRGWHIFPQGSPWRIWFAIIFWFLALSYILARFLERISPTAFTMSLIWIGSFWLGAMAYTIILLIAIDILRLLNFVIPFFPSFITHSDQNAKEIIGIIVAGSVVLGTIASHINANTPRVKNLELTIHKSSPLKTLNIAMASDIHLGTIICNTHLEKIVEKINSMNPDIVLFPGDIVDEDIEPIIRQNLGETIRKVRSKYGIYAVTGNHEYIGGAEAACRYLTEHGVQMLRDTFVTIANGFVLVGREDISRRQFGGHQRKNLVDLLSNIDATLPIILMDHQPFNLKEAVAAGIDLQLSGHTHHGQLWPFNYIAEAIYEVSWGYKQIGNTQFYVSCGVGTWGPPMRSGNRPEVVNIQLHFIE